MPTGPGPVRHERSCSICFGPRHTSRSGASRSIPRCARRLNIPIPTSRLTGTGCCVTVRRFNARHGRIPGSAIVRAVRVAHRNRQAGRPDDPTAVPRRARTDAPAGRPRRPRNCPTTIRPWGRRLARLKRPACVIVTPNWCNASAGARARPRNATGSWPNWSSPTPTIGRVRMSSGSRPGVSTRSGTRLRPNCPNAAVAGAEVKQTRRPAPMS
jgi:hypothetical protein